MRRNNFDKKKNKKNKSLIEILNQKKKQNRKVEIYVLSQEEIYNMSMGEVQNSYTIDYKNLSPVVNGLLDQAIFGPIENYKCLCLNQSSRRVNTICNSCGVEITDSVVRRWRMGHISLQTPVINFLFYNSYPLLAYVLNLKQSVFLEIINFKKFIVVNSDNENKYKKFSVLNDEQILSFIGYNDFITHENPTNNLIVSTGCEGILKCLQNINLELELKELLQKYDKSDKKLYVNSYDFKRARILRNLIDNKVSIVNFVFSKYFFVLPAGVRPVVQLKKIGSGAYGGSDLNKYYKTIINRNKRLGKMLSESVLILQPSRLLIKWYKKLVQLSCNGLIDSRRTNEYKGKKDLKVRKSILEQLVNKNGIIRGNMIGKRIDYSGRGVIVVNPYLKIDQIGIPIDIAIDLFQPYLIALLVKEMTDKNIFDIIRLVKNKDKIVYPYIHRVIKGRTVVVNRAPTLHRYNTQSFEIVLVEGDVIHFNPLICTGYNADFDGDQVMVYSLLHPSSEIESHVLLKSSNNLFFSTNGKILFMPNREMILGCFLLGMQDEKFKKEYKSIFFNEYEILNLVSQNRIKLQTKINLIYDDKILITTPGRVLFNSYLPKKCRNYQRNVDRKVLTDIIYELYNDNNIIDTLKFLDNIKQISFKVVTDTGCTLGFDDLVEIPKDKKKYIQEGLKFEENCKKLFMEQKITKQEMYLSTNSTWLKIFNILKKKLLEKLNLNLYNFLLLCLKSGARSSLDQIFQLCVVRGLFIDSNNVIINPPVLKSLKDYLYSSDFFVSSGGARKGIIDRSLKTGFSGYIYRRQSTVLSETIVDALDCKTKKFIIRNLNKDMTYSYMLSLLLGRYIVQDIIYQKDVIVKKNSFINYIKLVKIVNVVKFLKDSDILIVKYRNVNTCLLNIYKTICVKCFGLDLSTFKPVNLGHMVGINAAQSIGERSTQLTLRTFHSGGIATLEDKKTDLIKAITNCIIDYDLKKCFINKNKEIVVIFKSIEVKILNIKNKSILKSFLLKAGSIIYRKPGIKILKNDIIAKKNQVDFIYAIHDGKVVVENANIISKFYDIYSTTNYFVKKDIFSKNDVMKLKLVNSKNQILSEHIINQNTILFVDNLTKVKKGKLLGKTLNLKSAKQDITGSLPSIEKFFENVVSNSNDSNLIVMPYDGFLLFDNEHNILYLIDLSYNEYIKLKDSKLKIPNLIKKCKDLNCKIISFNLLKNKRINYHSNVYLKQESVIQEGKLNINYLLSKKFDVDFIQKISVDYISSIYNRFNIFVPLVNIELLISVLFSYCKIKYVPKFLRSHIFLNETMLISDVQNINKKLKNNDKIQYDVIFTGMSSTIYKDSNNFLNAIAYQHTIQNLSYYASKSSINKLNGVMKNHIINNDIRCGTSYFKFIAADKREQMIKDFLIDLRRIFIKYNVYNLSTIDKVKDYYRYIIEEVQSKYLLVYILDSIYYSIAKDLNNNIFSVLKEDHNIISYLLKKIIFLMLSEELNQKSSKENK